MKKITILLSFLFWLNFTQALTPLPKNSYLRLGDNDRAVKILQVILNSDPDTQVSDDGPGSPGEENWYFGKMTENALKRFQEKNNLEVTGRIDFKTWKVLNNYVLGISEITPHPSLNKEGSNADTITIKNKIQTADEKRKSINEQNKKDFEEAKKLSTEKAATLKAEAAESKKSYIQGLLDKYTGFFYTSKGDTEKGVINSGQTAPTNQDTYSNNYSLQTPYLNPNTGVYSSSPNTPTSQPVLQPQATQAQPNQTPYSQLFGNQSPYASYSGNPYANTNAPEYYASQAPFVNSGSPFTVSRWGGSGTGEGLGQVVTTVYGHTRSGGVDGLDNGVTACGQNSRLGGNGSKAISLKRSLRISIFGNVSKSGWCGKEIEVTNPRTGRCGVYPLLEEGPQEQLQAAMDMTGTVWNELDPERRDGSKNWFRFRVLKTGDQGCGK